MLIEIEALIERVEKATGPDRELDISICDELGWPDKAWAGYPAGPTSSLDAAVALVERLLPGIFYIIAKGKTRGDEPLYGVRLLFGTDEPIGEAEHDNRECCIVLATLRALQQKATAND
jgi:hypothetical protein